MRVLSKSRFKLGFECPNKLYFTNDTTFANIKSDDSFLKSLADGGFQVEELARLHYPDGKLIEDKNSDEGYDYEQRVKEYSRLLNVNTLFVSDIINEKRGLTRTGKKIYTLDDIYPHADLVTYPSTFEGFGNAFLEAVYFKKPIVVNKYSIYTFDIEPKGFLTVEIDGFVSEDAVRMARKVLEDPGFCKKMVDTNYEIAKRCFSYSVLRQKLRNLIYDGVACNPENMTS